MHLQMAIELIGNFSLAPHATKHPRQPDKPCTQRLHAYSSSSSQIRNSISQNLQQTFLPVTKTK
jgi:hypothetical protein